MNPGLNHIPIMPSNVRYWGKADITLTGSDVCFEPKRPRSARDAAIGNAAIGPPRYRSHFHGIRLQRLQTREKSLSKEAGQYVSENRV
jgi:hypothetical protein